ncbi:hypothetical protein B0H12DRAFT_1321788 [Mycena haematopus]|nr:hypothetical protein B0H12DRAFT_1321788 [Mycena haematopus]
MDKISSITAALDAGKFPSTQQLNALIDWLSHSVIPAVQPAEDSLSGQGRVLSNDVREILDAHKSLNSNKNHDNLLQDAIWHLNEGEVDTSISSPSDVVNKTEVSNDVDAVRSSLRTILSIVWQSLSTEGGFLFSDFASFARLALADAAEAVQDQAGRAKDGLRDIEQGVQDGQRDDLGRDKKRLEEEQDVRVAFEHGMDTLKDAGSGVIGAGQSAKETAENASDRTTSRLQTAYEKACARAQTDPAYRSSLSTFFSTLHKWVSKALDTALDQSFTLDALIDDPSSDKHIHKALNELKTLLDRFASTDDLFARTQAFVAAVRGDSVEVKSWVDKFFAHAQRSLEDPDYPRSADARAARRDLRTRARTLLDADTDAGRAWGELKASAQTFGAALAGDADVQRLRAAHARLGEDVERGLVQAGEEAETGVQAVLERASWFWRDLFAVYAPRMLSMLKDIPIPRTEYVDDEIELVLENLDISSFGLNPAHIFVRNITDVDVQTSSTGPASTGVGTFTHIRLQAVQLALQDVSFYYKDKTATMPPSEYTGLLGLTLPPQGIDVDIKIRLIPSAAERLQQRRYHIIERLDVSIADTVDVQVRDSNHALLLAVFKPIFNMRFREALGRTLGEQMRGALEWADGVGWDVGRRAEVFGDAGVEPGEEGGWRATGTGVVVEEKEQGGGAKFAMGAEPQVLGGEKRGPVGTASESLESRLKGVVEGVQGQTGDVGKAAEAATDVGKQMQGALKEGKRQVSSFQRSVEEKSARERQTEGWKSAAFDV